MNTIIKTALSLGLMICMNIVSGQVDSSALVQYTPDFKFADGIFLSFDQVKENNPIHKSRLISELDYDDPYFFEKVLENKKITYYDAVGVKQEVSPRKIWGYSRNGVLYIGVNEGFYRITIVGNICHFVANLTTYEDSYYNPYYGYNYYANPYYSRPVNRSTTEMRQYLLDFYTGKVIDYNESSIELLLMKDTQLYDEYMALKKKKKKQLKFLYIRKFNERNPLYIKKRNNLE